MKIIIAIRTAALRSIKVWKGVLIVWLLSLLMAAMVVIPMKRAFNSAIGSSMITEKLSEGINIEVFTDMGATLQSLVSYFSAGLFMSVLVSFLINSFLTGGLFDSLKGTSGKFSLSEFFRTSAKNFLSFLIILLIISLIGLILFFLTFVLPLSVANQAEVHAEGVLFKTGVTGISVYLLLMAVLLLVADYARAWHVAYESKGGFTALGFGFSKTFRTFFSSYPLMIIMLILQVSYLYIVLKIIPGITPASGWGVFYLFLLSQFMFFIKIVLKVLRYGSVTALMELGLNKN
jgi:hypothetical protein